MAKKRLIGMCAVVALACTVAVIASRAHRHNSLTNVTGSRETTQQVETSTVTQASPPGSRNLFLRPETRRVGRSSGRRLSSAGQHTSAFAGTLRIGSQVHGIQVVRRQTSDGESLEIMLDGSAVLLNWDAEQGARTTGRTLSVLERDLVERLVFDSPDQFVLAQLRGASYYTLASDVRPTEASDGYTGPLWDVVRVSEQADTPGKDRSLWKLYYVNVRTGLIDKVESEVAGQAMSASFTWSKQDTESFPLRITWTRAGQPFMEFNVSAFSASAQ